MIDEPGLPSLNHYVFERECVENYQGTFPVDGEYSIPRDIDTIGSTRQGHHKPEQLWGRD